MRSLSRPMLIGIIISAIIIVGLAGWRLRLLYWTPNSSNVDAQVKEEGSIAGRILARNKLRVGVRYDAKPFGFHQDDGQVAGFDIDLAHEFARRWLGDANAVEFIEVSSSDRVPRLAAGEMDLLIAALPYKRERDALIDFSQTYFLDGQSLLVRRDSGIHTLAEMNGRFIAAIQGSSAIDNILNVADATKVNIQMRPVPAYPQALEALKAKQVDALTADSVTLIELAQSDPELMLISGRLTQEPYSIGLPQNNSHLRELVNFTLADMKADGTYDKLYQTWFPTDMPFAVELPPGQSPYTLDKIPAEPNSTPSRLETILQRGKLIAGINTDFQPFTVVNSDGTRSGFDLDILHEFARRWLGDANAVEFIPATPAEQVDKLVNGSVDLAAAAMVERRDWAAKIDYSQTYLGAPIVNQPLSIGLPENDSALRELINVTLQELKADGTYDTIYSRWFGETAPKYALEIVPGDADYLLLPFRKDATAVRGVTSSTESSIGRIRGRGNLLRVGVTDNKPPFGFVDSTGQHTGFDLELVQALAQQWNISVEFVAVSPADYNQKLATGDIDMLAAAMPRTKDQEEALDFSETYFEDGQSLLTLAGANIQGVVDLNNRSIATLQGAGAADQLQAVADQQGIALTLQPFPSYEQALTALRSGTVAALAGDYIALTQFAKQDPTLTLASLLFAPEPYAIGLPSGDSYFNNLVNITLQVLKQNGTYDRIYHRWFGDNTTPYSIEIFPGTWPYSFDKSPTTLDKPVRSKINDILEKRKIIAGVLFDFKPFGFIDANNQPAGFDTDIMREFAKRWLGDATAVELVPVTTDSAIQQLAAGAVDLVAAALIHKRDGDLEIDFSQTYFEDGQGLLVRANTEITNLAGLNGKVVAAIQGSPAKENLESYAASHGITINILPFQELTQALEALRAGQVDGLTAASAVLIQFAQENPGLRVVEERFSSEPYGLGIPNYDDRFQDLVNFTLQEMKQDGTYDRLYTKWFNKGRPYNLRVEPGGSYLDFDLIPMLKVPTGEFKRGNPNGFPDERFEQTVFLNDYYIDQYEVTNRQYEGCVSAGQCTLPRLPRSVNFAQYYAGSDYGNFPVIWISWQDARNYCEFRGKRLPSEAEWEAAARGPQATLYPWGNQEPTTEANFNYSQRDVTSVGSFPADISGYGAFDMGGNVREWVADWYQWDYYLSAPAQNPAGPVAGVTKVLRGGSWNDIAAYLRSTVRKNFLPDSFDGNLGFRCASSNFPPSR